MPPRSTRHSAPGQYLGYGLQPVRFCYRLLTGEPGSWVSIEHDDDVSVLNADGSRVLEQDKSATKGNPLTDFGEDLWKTIAIWIETTDLPEKGAPGISYHLYVVAPKPVNLLITRYELNFVAPSHNDALIHQIPSLTVKSLAKLGERLLGSFPNKDIRCDFEQAR